jgi:hypothetical protein
LRACPTIARATRLVARAWLAWLDLVLARLAMLKYIRKPTLRSCKCVDFGKNQLLSPPLAPIVRATRNRNFAAMRKRPALMDGIDMCQ